MRISTNIICAIGQKLIHIDKEIENFNISSLLMSGRA